MQIDRTKYTHLSSSDMVRLVDQLKPMELEALSEAIVEHYDKNNIIGSLLAGISEVNRFAKSISASLEDAKDAYEAIQEESLKMNKLLSGKESKKKKNGKA
jgi:hydroxymethylglutaryl-CoA reductase